MQAPPVIGGHEPGTVERDRHGTLPEGRESQRELELIPAGEFRMRPHNGRGPFFNRDPRAVTQHSQAQGYSLVFDYDHVTELAKGTAAPAPASGRIQHLFVRDGAVEWTEKADAAIDAREYRYYSPVLMHDKGKPPR